MTIRHKEWQAVQVAVRVLSCEVPETDVGRSLGLPPLVLCDFPNVSVTHF